MIELELLTRHEHAGSVYNVGDKITVDMSVANWLISEGKATKAVAPVKSKADDKQA